MNKPARGIQSIEVGGQLLQAVATAGHALALKDVAARAGMSPSKAHAYLVSWGRVGLIAQDPDSGHYGLGPLAMTLGLISLQQHDPIRLASAPLESLAVSTACTVALAVWGTAGPTVVRVAEAPTPLHVTVRHGTVLNLHQTATGQAMAAHRPEDEVEALWRRQLAPEHATPEAWSRFKSQLAQVAQRGHAWSDAGLLPGASALAVAACDALGWARWALVAVALHPQWADAAAQTKVLAALIRARNEVSRQLGWQPPAAG